MNRIKKLFPGKDTPPSWEGLRERGTDGSGIVVGSSISLSTPIVSTQDGPRMSMKNFGGKKAAPFVKGGKRRAKVLAAKSAVRKSVAKAAVKSCGCSH